MEGEFVELGQEFLVFRKERVAFGIHARDCETAGARTIHRVQVIVVLIQAQRTVPAAVEIQGALLVSAVQIAIPLRVMSAKDGSQEVYVRKSTTSVEDSVDDMVIDSDLV